MPFAELDGNAWVVVIGAITLGALQILALALKGLSMVLDFQREKSKAKRDAEVADKVEAVKEQAATAATLARTAAIKVTEVKHDLAVSTEASSSQLNELASIAHATHVLVNNNMAVQLKLNAELSRWKAGQTGLAADAEAANQAEHLYAMHQLRQGVVDASEVAQGKPPP